MNLIVEIALRATVVLAMAWLATALLHRSSADVRSWIWRSALTAVVLLFIPIPMPDPFLVSSVAMPDAPGPSSDAAAFVPVLQFVWITGLALQVGRLGINLFALSRLTGSACAFRGREA